jgi:transcriptional regulator with XRE-family HTH domain
MVIQIANIQQIALADVIYNASDYWSPLSNDIANVRGSILIHSPFITDQALERWVPPIQSAIAHGVLTTVVLQQPRFWERRDTRDVPFSASTQMQKMVICINALTQIGVHVVLRNNIHAKLILIDDSVLWEGSLNFLSHFDTTEHLRRSVNRDEIEAVKTKQDLRRLPNYAIDSDTDERLLQLIIQRRRHLGLSQSELGRKISTGQPYISRMENGNLTLLNRSFRAVAQCLDLRIRLVPSRLCKRLDALLGSESDVSMQGIHRRKLLGMTQVELAKHAAIPQADVSRLECGKLIIASKPFRSVLGHLDLQVRLVPAFMCGPVDAFLQKSMPTLGIQNPP